MNTPKKTAMALLGLVFLVQLYYFSRNIWFMFFSSGSFGFSGSLTLVFHWLVMFTGLGAFIGFLVGKGRRSLLLQVYTLYSFYTTFFGLVANLILYSRLEQVRFIPLLTFGLEILYSAVYLFATLVLRRDRTPRFTVYGTPEKGQPIFFPADKGLRFANRLLDNVFLITLLLSLWCWEYLKVGVSGHDEDFLALVFIGLFLPFTFLLYYILSESLFKTTLGKLITGTTVINEEGVAPGFWQVVGRTFCRIIPFEQWSFLFADRGWHDSISGTYVIKEKYGWEPNEQAPENAQPY